MSDDKNSEEVQKVHAVGLEIGGVLSDYNKFRLQHGADNYCQCGNFFHFPVRTEDGRDVMRCIRCRLPVKEEEES